MQPLTAYSQASSLRQLLWFRQNIRHHGVPESAPDEEADAYDDDASATSSEADMIAIEL